MPIIRIEYTIPDFEAWKRVFDQDPAGRAKSGVRRYTMMRSTADPTQVFIDLEFQPGADVQAFLGKLRQIWSGIGKKLVESPKAQAVEIIEVRELREETAEAHAPH